MTHKSFRLEYFHPEDGRFMSFRHSMASGPTTSELLKVIKWAMNNGVELRIRPDDAVGALDSQRVNRSASLTENALIHFER
jgi:hypothetical protein